MAAVGRGRSWAMASDQGVLRRPGEVPIPTALGASVVVPPPAGTTLMDNLLASVQAVNLNDPSALIATLRNFDEALKSICITGELLRCFVNRLHDRSLEDRHFGVKAASCCGFCSSFEVDGLKLRTLLLSAVQKDYDEYAQLQTSNAAKFLNSVALLSEIYHRVRLNDGSPVAILATPVLHYLDILLGGEEHEMELFTSVLSVNGRKLTDSSFDEMEDLLLRTRNVLMSRNLSGQCRCWLILALDLASNHFAPLRPALQGFYQVHLGSTALSQLQRLGSVLNAEKNTSLLQTYPIDPAPQRLLHTPITQTTSVPAKSSAVTPTVPLAASSIPSVAPTVAKGLEEEVKGVSISDQPSKYNIEDNSNRNWRENNGQRSKPRTPTDKGNRKYSFPSSSSGVKEEPGSWRTDRQNSAEEKWGGSKSQGWGHDDRFEKDENFYGRQEPRNKGPKPGRAPDTGNRGYDKPTNKPKIETAIPPLPDDEDSWD